jgi:oligoendopeptidase F
MALLTSKFAFLNPEILKIQNIEEWILKEPLSDYHFQLSELLRNKKHILSEQEEAILARVSVPLNNFNEIHGKWNDADLKFMPALDSLGKENIVSNYRYSLNLQSQDRTLRQNTFQSYYQEIAKWRNTMTSNYYGNMLSGSTVARIRNFTGYLEAELFQDNIPVAIYDNLIAVVFLIY